MIDAADGQPCFGSKCEKIGSYQGGGFCEARLDEAGDVSVGPVPLSSYDHGGGQFRGDLCDPVHLACGVDQCLGAVDVTEPGIGNHLLDRHPHAVAHVQILDVAQQLPCAAPVDGRERDDNGAQRPRAFFGIGNRVRRRLRMRELTDR